jgi:plasmid stability protein
MAQQVTITLDDDVAERLKREAARRGVTIEDLIVAILRQSLQDVDVKAKRVTL